jgi:hypothetical protein
MSDVQAALATLRKHIGYLPPYHGGYSAQDAQHTTDVMMGRLDQREASSAIDTVEQALRDAEIKERALTDYFADASRRADEAEQALRDKDYALAEERALNMNHEGAVARLTAERDEWMASHNTATARVNEAEAEVARLRDALRTLDAEFHETFVDTGEHLEGCPGCFARAALGECDGSCSCHAVMHVHGCFRDFGTCDRPDEHREEQR